MSNTVRTVHRVKLEDVRPSRYRYSRAGTQMDRKLAYVLSKRGQTRAILVRDIIAPVLDAEAFAGMALQMEGPEQAPAPKMPLSRFSHYEIVDGHRVYDAMKANGAKTCTCVSVGEVDELEALLMAIEHNESRGPINHVDLAKAFKALSEASIFEGNSLPMTSLLQSTGKRFPASEVAARIDFDEEQVELYKKLLDFDVEAFAKGGQSGQEELLMEPEGEDLR